MVLKFGDIFKEKPEEKGFISRINRKINKFKEEEFDENLIKEFIYKKGDENKEKNLKIKIENLRMKLIEYISVKLFLMLILIDLILFLAVSMEIGTIFLVLVIMGLIFILYWPKLSETRKHDDLNQDLPYALRHMGTELKSGKGLHDTLKTISKGNYGSLSEEFNRVLEEIKYGKNTEESLFLMSKRVNSEGLKRAIHQIIGTLRVGGNLANSLNIIAEDITFDMEIKLKEYSQKLNSFILIYTFIAILAPVILLIMLMAGSTVMGDIVSKDILFIVYIIFFPMIVILLAIFMKKLEPKI